MEHSKIEVAMIAEIVAGYANDQILELNELQLALVGGGDAEVIFA